MTRAAAERYGAGTLSNHCDADFPDPVADVTVRRNSADSRERVLVSYTVRLIKDEWDLTDRCEWFVTSQGGRIVVHLRPWRLLTPASLLECLLTVRDLRRRLKHPEKSPARAA